VHLESSLEANVKETTPYREVNTPNWLKSATYLASTIAGIAGTAFPVYAIYLIPLSTFLAGFATTHPNDYIPTTVDPNAVKKLTAQIQAQLAANEKAGVKA
jgi:hypothetical protein